MPERIEAEHHRKEEEKFQREELARMERFDKLVKFWLENQNRRSFLKQLRETIGDVGVESALGQWIEWAEGYIERAEPGCHRCLCHSTWRRLTVRPTTGREAECGQDQRIARG
jgi:hypothetical protein